MLEHRPRLDQRPPHIDRIQIRVGRDESQQPLRLTGQRLLRPGRQHPRHGGRRCWGCNFWHNTFNYRCLLKNHMRIGAADPERRHPGPPRPAVNRPRPRLSQQRHRPHRPIHMRRRNIHMQCLGHHPMPHRLHHLDHPGHPRRRRCMTDVRFDRPQPQGLNAVLTVGRQKRLRLNRIPQHGPGPVPLDHIHLNRAQSRTGQRRPNHPLLGWPIGCRQTVGGAVLIDRRSAHQGQHRMPQPPGIHQPLHHQHPGAF